MKFFHVIGLVDSITYGGCFLLAVSVCSLYMMINKKTIKSSFVKEVWAEIEPHGMNCDAIINVDKKKLLQFDVDTADNVRTGLAVSS